MDTFVLYEHAASLDRLGFNEPCIARYHKGKFVHNTLGNWYRHNSGEIDIRYIAAPTVHQTFQWIRDNFNLYPNIWKSKLIGCTWKYTIIDDEDRVTDPKCFKTYPECEVDCITEMIKIINKNK